MKYIYGPIPSRRLGTSLGVSPIPKKACNYSCIYCQLGRTNIMTNSRQKFFDIDEILAELEEVIHNNVEFDVITIVGEGEPTLYSELGSLISGIKKCSEKPVAVITNSALLYDSAVREELMQADIVLPSMDAFDENTFKKINRPYGKLKYEDIYRGLIEFCKEYTGQLWLEIMFIKDINDSDEAVEKYKELLSAIKYDRLYLNTVVRPPAESNVQMVSSERLKYISNRLGGISIDLLCSGGFYSDIEDTYDAIISIIKRHPMNQYEIDNFINSRKDSGTTHTDIFDRLNNDIEVDVIRYKGYDTYRLK